MIIEKTGNIFTTKAQTIVNTVNCVGFMGAGIAYEFKLREPDMFHKYKQLCQEHQIQIGKLWIHTVSDVKTYAKVLNFPTKLDWKHPSQEKYLHEGLEKFVTTYEQKSINSIAFPLLGADKGGLDKNISLKIMHQYLDQCDINVEIWHFDPYAKDDLYEDFKSIFLEIETQTIKEQSSIKKDKIELVKKNLQREDINSLSGLLRVRGIGDVTIEKLFSFVKHYNKSNKSLFDF